jgi:hypothetical protein
LALISSFWTKQTLPTFVAAQIAGHSDERELQMKLALINQHNQSKDLLSSAAKKSERVSFTKLQRFLANLQRLLSQGLQKSQKLEKKKRDGVISTRH